MPEGSRGPRNVERDADRAPLSCPHAVICCPPVSQMRQQTGGDQQATENKEQCAGREGASMSTRCGNRHASPLRPDPSSLTRRCALVALGVAVLARRAGAATLRPLSRVLVELKPPQEPPAFSFLSAAGKKLTLADYRGKGVVLNIWATWCVPCVAEMPALDRLSQLVAALSISVLPVSIDAKGLGVVKAYYAAHRIEHLPVLLDPDGSIAAAFKVPGIPASFLFDRKGRLVAHCLGAADWDTPRAVATIRRLVSDGKDS